MSCCCSHIVTRWNPCCCQPGPTTTSSTTTTTLCPNGELCDEVVDPRCIIYNGPDIPCYGIETGDSAADILDIIISYFICPTTTTTTLVPTTTTSSTTTTTTVEPTTTTTSSTTTSTTLEPSTTTSTTSSTTTTTTIDPTAPKTEIIIINDESTFGTTEVIDIRFNGISMNLLPPEVFPITNGKTVIGNYFSGTVYTVEVTITGDSGIGSVYILDSTCTFACLDFDGSGVYSFSGLTLDDTVPFACAFTIEIRPIIAC